MQSDFVVQLVRILQSIKAVCAVHMIRLIVWANCHKMEHKCPIKLSPGKEKTSTVNVNVRPSPL